MRQKQYIYIYKLNDIVENDSRGTRARISICTATINTGIQRVYANNEGNSSSTKSGGMTVQFVTVLLILSLTHGYHMSHSMLS